MEPYKLTATEVIAQIRDGSLTVEDYAKSLLSRIEQRDPVVKAWAYLDPDLVLKRARELDQIPPDQRGPLHGVAVGVKDVIYTKDMPTQHNSPIYTADAPALDAGCVAVLRQAGALILGKTTTTQFAATVAGPPTTNPHDPARTPGGSSSGSGAAVGDFQVPLALGTQTGGSTIRPGSFNGVYAFKPTWGAVSREGLKIYSLVLDTLGLYARSVGDLEVLADVFALTDDEAVERREGVEGMRFALLKNARDVFPEPGTGTKGAMEKAVRLLRENGASVEEVGMEWPEFGKIPAWHRCIMSTDGRTAFLPEYRTNKEKLDGFLVGHVENAGGYTHKARLEALDGIGALRPRVDEVLGRFDALITPSVLDEAPLGIESTGSAAFNGAWTALHVPVVNVPGFCGENGLPVGVSLVAPRYRDRHLLAVSGEVGKIFEGQGGWTRKNI
ncbi:amidase [Coniochaeta ligniaria NRRL 30616]|uniref:Amidase n=1 Tax=Coniochaeta ligniaria NRRL 30616 TaxID=1408157 RepID=A0A1J7K035_9PEZI|nr:amidase [Coniochaeta ligniaria NRRL 30616]